MRGSRKKSSDSPPPYESPPDYSSLSQEACLKPKETPDKIEPPNAPLLERFITRKSSLVKSQSHIEPCNPSPPAYEYVVISKRSSDENINKL